MATRRTPLSHLTNSPVSPATPPKKGSSTSKLVSPSTSRHVGLASAVASPTPNLPNFGEHDEGRQKKDSKRRRSVGHELHRKNLASGGASNSPNANAKTPDVLNGYTSAELANHYKDCITLSTENKINAKNAFGLHLIDYMTELVKKKEMENFQVASSTLDASVKIYAGRVDFIHTHTYKVLSGLGGNKAKGNDDDHDNGDVDGEVEGESAKPKKKKKAGRAKTIVTNLKEINAPKFDLEFEVDPMFQMMSAAFDEGGASGLLLNRLRCWDNSQALVLDSSTQVNVIEDVQPEEEEQRKDIDIDALREMLGGVNLEDKYICPSLCDFKFNEWDKDMDMMHKQFSDFAFNPSDSVCGSPGEDDLDLAPTSTTVSEDQQAIISDEIDNMDNMVDDLDGLSIAGDSVTGGDMRTAEFVESAFSDLSSGSAGKLRQILAMQPSDYSYFNKMLMQTWAGPAHWKIAAGAKRVVNRTAEDSRTKRKKKAPLKLTYDTKEDDVQLKMSKATTVTEATWAKYTKKRTTLPDDQQLDTKELLFRLFHRPQLMIKWQSGDTSGVDDHIENYDYNNKNDVENFCPIARIISQLNMDDDDIDDEDCSGGFDGGFDETHIAQASHNNMTQGSLFSEHDGTILTQDKLVAAPHKVQKIDIKYAKSAKRVDVKRLKSTIWNILTSKEKPVFDVPLPVPSTQEEVLTSISIPQHFSELKESLPCNVPSGMAKNLTIQTLFSCLLYLTNEKTLKLSSSDTMDDIFIEQDASATS